MKRKTVLLVGPRSSKKVTHGMSIAFDTLIFGLVERDIPHLVVNRSAGNRNRKIGAFSFSGVIMNLVILFRFFIKFLFSSIIYIAIGTSSLGFFRDAIMIWSAKIFKKRVVLHLHGGGYKHFYESSPYWFKRMIRLTFTKVDTIIVLGQLLRDQFYFVPRIENKIKVVPNGLPLKVQDPYIKPKHLSISKPMRLLYLSNLVPSKGFLDVLEACKILYYDRNISIHCDFCGAFIHSITDKNVNHFQAENIFRNRIHEYGLSDIVKYHGTVRGEKKIKLLKRAHIFILPTYYPWEGQPISIIEAQAFGIPVIATPYRGIPEQIKHQYNGLLVAPKNPRQIADEVEKLWRLPQLYHQMSKNALKHFNCYFTQDAHLDRLIPVILGNGDYK